MTTQPAQYAPADPTTHVDIVRDLLGPPPYKDVYALRVTGNDFLDALINAGDMLIMRHTADIADGDMAAVWVHSLQCTTVKRVTALRDAWGNLTGMVELKAENPNFQTLVLPVDDVKIQGKLVAVIRQT